MPTSFFTYFRRVYLPSNIFANYDESHSTYTRKTMRRLQANLWISFTLFAAVLGYHVRNLYICERTPRESVCFITLYTWAAYGGLLAVVCLSAMLLHYGYVDEEEYGASHPDNATSDDSDDE